MVAKLNADGTVTLSFDGKARLYPSKSGKSYIVAKIVRPERIPGTEINFIFTAYIPKAQAIAEGLSMATASDDAAA